jgi:hypothetical protein
MPGGEFRGQVTGTAIDQEIAQRLEQSDIVLLLVSADFLASDYCYSVELRRALERHQQNLTRVVPIILRPVDWQHSPIGELKALPRDGKPVTNWRIRDAAFENVAHELRRLIEAMPHR